MLSGRLSRFDRGCGGQAKKRHAVFCVFVSSASSADKKEYSMQNLEIFKPGKHTAMSGAAISFSDSDLAASAKAYNPTLHEAPIVIGHPRADAPAYGWIKSLSFSGERLLAEPDQVDAAFADLVNKGKFKKISASFYAPAAPHNPVPGVYYLRHVGFLGAMPPAIKGLKTASFADSEDGIVEFGNWNDRVAAGLWRGLREWLISKFGIDEADKVIPSQSVTDLETSAAMSADDGGMVAMPAYSENPKIVQPPAKEKEVFTAEELAAREAELKQKEADFAEREAKLKRIEIAARHAGHVFFAEDLVKAGKMLPAQKDHAVAILDFAADLERQTVEFGESKQSPLDSLKSFLAAQPKAIEYGEIATPEKDMGKRGAAEKLEALTRDKLKAKPDLGFTVAFSEVQSEHPDLAREYADSMRG
jgi:hypothetical protein